MKLNELCEEAFPRYKRGQELIVSGKEGFQATTTQNEGSFEAGKMTVTPGAKTQLFKNNQSGADWIVTFDRDDGEHVYFQAGKNKWRAEREPFYSNVVSRGKNFLNTLVDKGDDEGTPTS